jgi:hypothetical protein
LLYAQQTTRWINNPESKEYELSVEKVFLLDAQQTNRWIKKWLWWGT